MPESGINIFSCRVPGVPIEPTRDFRLDAPGTSSIAPRTRNGSNATSSNAGDIRIITARQFVNTAHAQPYSCQSFLVSAPSIHIFPLKPPCLLPCASTIRSRARSSTFALNRIEQANKACGNSRRQNSIRGRNSRRICMTQNTDRSSRI